MRAPDCPPTRAPVDRSPGRHRFGSSRCAARVRAAPSMFDLGPPTSASVRAVLAKVGCHSQVFPPGTDHAHACLSAPAAQAGACAVQFNASSSWPNHSSLTKARDKFQNMSFLLVGDSTLENKELFLHRLLQVNDSCRYGNGSCFVSVGRHVTRTPKACPNIGGPGRTDFDVVHCASVLC